jgi:hypothetical protein
MALIKEKKKMGFNPAVALAEKLMVSFDEIIEERQNYYGRDDVVAPNKDDIKDIIKSYSKKNLKLSAAAGLLPGPWGMAAAIPETIMVLKNQIAMIYDIGIANNKPPEKLSKVLLLGVMLSGAGKFGGGVLIKHGSQFFVKRAGQEVIQKAIKVLGGNITLKLAKSSASKFIPLAGAAALGVWSSYSTKKVGNQADEILSQELIVEQEESDENLLLSPEQVSNVEPEIQQSNDVEIEKVKILINLMKIDKEISEDEKKYISPIIEGASFDDADKKMLYSKFDTKSPEKINYDLINKYPDDAVSILMDTIALAKIDKKFHPTEKMYIKQLGEKMGFSKEDVVELLEE